MCRDYMSIAVKTYVKHFLQPVEKIEYQKYSFPNGICPAHQEPTRCIDKQVLRHVDYLIYGILFINLAGLSGKHDIIRCLASR